MQFAKLSPVTLAALLAFSATALGQRQPWQRHAWQRRAAAVSVQPTRRAGWTPTLAHSMGGARDPHYHAPSGRVELRRRYVPTAGDPGRGHLFTVRVANANVGYMHEAHYSSVRDVSLELLRQFSPNSHFFIGVGRSPVALVTFMRLLNDSMAMTFPASDMRLKIEQTWRQEYFRHFEQLIPPDVVRGNRAIVLFDRARAQSGVGLSVLAGYLREWLATQGSTVQVNTVGLSPQGPLQNGVTHVDTAAHPELFLYQQGQFDHDEAVAPFVGKHRIGAVDVDALEENPQHERLREALKQRMRADAQLDQVLSREFATTVEGDDP